jgi:hypothetical protein
MTLQELVDFFGSQELPATAQLNRSTRIVDVPGFLEAQYLQVQLYGIDSPAYLRLMQFREWLISGAVDYVKPEHGSAVNVTPTQAESEEAAGNS